MDDLNRDTFPGEKESVAYWRKPEVRMQDSVKADLMVSVFNTMNRFYSHKFGRQVMPDYLSKSQMDLKMRSLMTKDIFKSLDLREPLKKYRGRCTTIRPRQDSVPEEVPWKIKESVPQTKFVFIERCGHMVDLEKPAEFLAKIRQALTE